MKRRQFLSALGWTVTFPPMIARAQQQGRLHVVGILEPSVTGSPLREEWFRVFKEKMQEYGWIEDQTVRFERRMAGTDIERTKREAAALVELAPDVLLASSTVVTGALAERTREIPIVFIGVGDPIQSGFSDSLARPSRNMTGFTVFDPEMGGKFLQFLKDLKPDLKRVTAIFNPDIGAGRYVLDVFMTRTRQLGRDMGLELKAAHVRNATEIEAAISGLGPDDGLWVGADTTIFLNIRLIIELAARHRIPAIYSWAQHVRAGGLMTYSADQLEGWRKAADYVNRLLRGTKLVEMPIQRPPRFAFDINLATAKALGLTVPRELLVLARDIIE